jgi:hypothetical protein
MSPCRSLRAAIALVLLVVGPAIGRRVCAAEVGVGQPESASGQEPPPEPAPPPFPHPWRWRLTPPLAGAGFIWGARLTPVRDTSRPALLFTISYDAETSDPRRGWMLEGEVGGVFQENEGRTVLRVRTGPSWMLADTRERTGRGSTLAAQAQFGLTAWGQFLGPEYSDAYAGLLGAMVQVGLEGVRWTSDASGWCARLRGTVESLFYNADGRRRLNGTVFLNSWATAILVDLGRAW